MKTGKIVIGVLCVALLAVLTAPAAFGSDSAGFTISRMVVSENVENREPVGESESFSLSMGSVYCFLEAKDIDADTDVHFVWYHEGDQKADVALTIRKGNRWRTYSSKKLGNWKGAWKVELQDSDKTVLKTVEFNVE